MAPDSCCIGVSEMLRRFASYRRCTSAPDVQVDDLPLALYTHIKGMKKNNNSCKDVVDLLSNHIIKRPLPPISILHYDWGRQV